MLCSNTDIQDNDWDSVRQANAALIRDVERLALAFGGGGNDLGGAVPKSANDQTVSQDGNYGFPSVTTDMLDDLERRINAAIDNVVVDPNVGGDLSGVCSNATVTKIRGVNISPTQPSADEQVMMYNKPSLQWEPISLITGSGGLLTNDGAGLVEIAGGTALSVVGNATNTTGSINAIAAGSSDTLLGRRGASLTWAKISTNEINDAAITKAKMENGAAVSVIGRSVNSSGVTADIPASSNDTVLGRRSNTLTWAKVSANEMADIAGFSVIGRSNNTTGTPHAISSTYTDGVALCCVGGSLNFTNDVRIGKSVDLDGYLTIQGKTTSTVMQLTSSGSNATITIGNSTSSSAITISPSLINTTGKVMSIREIDVCDAGVAKKMLVLASAPY